MADEQNNRLLWQSRLDRLWRFAVGLLAANLLSYGLLGLMFLTYHRQSQEPTVQPLLVYVDGQDRILWTQPPAPFIATDGIILERVAQWVQWVRFRPGAPLRNQPLIKQHWDQAFKMTTEAARPKLLQYMKETDPLLEANQHRSVDVQVLSQGKSSTGVYQVVWRERTVDPKARLLQEKTWEGLFPVMVREPGQKVRVQEANDNAAGIWIGEFSWWEVPDANSRAAR